MLCKQSLSMAHDVHGLQRCFSQPWYTVCCPWQSGSSNTFSKRMTHKAWQNAWVIKSQTLYTICACCWRYRRSWSWSLSQPSQVMRFLGMRWHCRCKRSVKAFLPLQGMTLIPHVNSRAPFDFAKISALPQDITDDIVCDTLQSFPICSIRRFLVHCTPVRVDKCEVSIPQHTAS